MYTTKKIEEIEYDYLEQLYFSLTSNRWGIADLLKTKDQIKSDWYDKFEREDKDKSTGEMSRGAERILYALMPNNWVPNSSPIGSDLFYESHKAFIHIDIKTAKINNTSDYRGVVPLGKNQTSYPATESFRNTPINTKPNLPYIYSNGKICLTYAIQIIYNPETNDIIAIILICIPNGRLFKIYKNEIANSGKTKDESFRYAYKRSPNFELLDNNPPRVKFVYFNDNTNLKREDITSVNLESNEIV